jgi:hypothetical protein
MHARAPANLADDPLEWIVGLHLAPVIARKREVRQRLVRLGFDQLSRLG